MSGGSHNYLCNSNFMDIMCKIEDMEYMELSLIRLGYDDIARDVRRLIEYCKTAENRITVLSDNLHDVFWAVEWYCSADIGEETMKKTLNEYRNSTLKPKGETE